MSGWSRRARAVLVAAALGGCVHAFRPGPEGGLEGVVQLRAPEGWRPVRNRRFARHHELILRSPDGCCTITVEVLPLDRRSAELPLDLLADTLPLEMGRDQGLAAEPLARHQILVDGREAWAITYRLHHGPHRRLATSVVVRDDRYLALLTLSLPDTAPPEVLSAWDGLLDSLRLPGPVDPDAPPFEPEPFFEPSP